MLPCYFQINLAPVARVAAYAPLRVLVLLLASLLDGLALTPRGPVSLRA